MRRFRWFGGLACAALLSLAMAGAWAQDEGAGEAPAVAPEYEVEVTLESGEVLRGRLRDEGDTLVIETADGPVEVPRADVTGIRQGDLVPLPPLPGPEGAPEPEPEPEPEPMPEEPLLEPMPDDTGEPMLDTPPEELPPEELPPEELPPEEMPEELPPEEMPEELPPEEMPEELPPEELPAEGLPPLPEEGLPPIDAPTEEPPPAELPPVETPEETLPPEELPPIEPVDEPPPEELPPVDTPSDLPPEELPSVDMPPEELPPPSDLPSDLPPEELPPPSDLPPDLPPPSDLPPDLPPPSDLPPEDLPPDLPPEDLPPEDLPPTDLPPPTEPEPIAPRDTVEPETHTAESTDEVVEVTAYYPDEEREFGPIMPDYRGPVELSLYAGWSIFSPELDWTTGAVLGGARFTVNGGEESEIGIDFNWGVTRTQYALSEGGATARGEVTVHTFMAGLTYRMSFLRSHLLTPFVRVAMGAVYFDESEFSVRAGTTRIRGKLPASYGWAGQLGLGLDYKLAKNWSFRMESSVDLWITDWREGKHGWEGLVQGNVFQAGIVWHFQ